MTSEFTGIKTENNSEMTTKSNDTEKILINNSNTEIEYESSSVTLEFKQKHNNNINEEDNSIITISKDPISILNSKRIHYNETIYDPILDENACNKLNLKDKKYSKLWDNYITQRSCHWTPDELDFSQDYQTFLKLSEQKQKVIKMILAFFANIDSIVNINISQNITSKIHPIEIKMGYDQQVAMENIHIETYTHLLDVLIKDEKEKDYLFNSIKNIESVKLIADWAFNWIDSNVPLACKIVAFACIEGILFSSAFAFIFWLKQQFIGEIGMEGLFRSNEFISRDEGLHKDYGVLIFQELKNKPSNQLVIDIIKESVEIGKVFNQETIQNDIQGMSSNEMNTYIKYVADRLCYSLIGKKIYNAKNPFPFMETIGMQSKTNFHESRNTEYKNAHNSFSTNNNKLVMTDDF